MKKYITKLTETTLLIAVISLIAISASDAQKISIPANKQAATQPTYKSLFWADEIAGVEIFLIEGGSAKRDFNLVVVSEKDAKVIYHTSRNSREPIVKELTPVKSKNGRSYFNVLHNFSRTTIWMALEFQIDGKRIDSLTRTFYDGMFNIVPDEQFLKFAPK